LRYSFNSLHAEWLPASGVLIRHKPLQSGNVLTPFLLDLSTARAHVKGKGDSQCY